MKYFLTATRGCINRVLLQTRIKFLPFLGLFTLSVYTNRYLTTNRGISIASSFNTHICVLGDKDETSADWFTSSCTYVSFFAPAKTPTLLLFTTKDRSVYRTLCVTHISLNFSVFIYK